MSDPFRDQNAALVERVAQLEGENQELRARLDDEVAAKGENREAFVTRMQEENRELRARLRILEEKLARAEASRRARPQTDWIDELAKIFRRD